MPFNLQSTSGYPLRVLENGDDTSTLIVAAIFSPEFDKAARINVPQVSATTTPGIEQTLISYSVPAGKKHTLTKSFFSCRVEGVARIYIGGEVFATQRTSGAEPNAIIDMSPSPEIVLSGVLVETKFTARLSSAVTEVESKIIGFETDS